jgi:hypothetical protein
VGKSTLLNAGRPNQHHVETANNAVPDHRHRDDLSRHSSYSSTRPVQTKHRSRLNDRLIAVKESWMSMR